MECIHTLTDVRNFNISLTNTFLIEGKTLNTIYLIFTTKLNELMLIHFFNNEIF